MKTQIKSIFMYLLFTGIIIAQETTSSATLPLPDLIKLYQDIESAKEKPKKMPPIKASITTIQLEGHLLEDAIDITAHMEVVVLDSEEWVSVPLFEIDKTINISSLPDIENAVLTRTQGTISLITNKQGTYSFALSFIKRASLKLQKRSAIVVFGNASQSELCLRYDEDLFRVLDENLIVKSDHAVVYPVNNVFSINWEQKRKNSINKNVTEKRPPIESMISKAHVSSVSTLEGKLITRVLYNLHFEGSKMISVEIPETYSLEKVYLNGSAIPFKNNNNQVNLEVFPSRAGDLAGNLELVITKLYGNYHLSGLLSFIAPKVSWPIHEMYLDLFLPAVFNYTRSAGSFEPIQESPDATFTFNVPLPGKKHSFHQYLITSTSPTLTIDYTIDLTNKYFSVE